MGRPKSAAVTVRYDPTRRRTPWRIEYRVDHPETGRRERESESFATEAEARAAAVTIAAALARLAAPAPPIARVPTAVTLRAHVAEWLATIVSRRKASTAAMYTCILRKHILEAPLPDGGRAGDRLLTRATFGSREIAHVIGLMQARGYAWGYQQLAIASLSAALVWAVKWDRLPANPCDDLASELRPADARDPAPNPLAYAEAEALLVFLKTGQLPAGYDATVARPRDAAAPPVEARRPPRIHRRTSATGYPTWFPYFLLLLHTGLRRGEATALRWSHVFLEAPKPYLEIDVTYSAEARRAAQRGQRQYPIDGLVAPKTRHSRRRVWLSPEAADTLRELARLRRERAFRARRELSPFVFVGPRSGTRVDPAITNKVFATAIAAIGLAHWRPAFTVHDLRHTFATVHLGRWRSPLAWVSAMLGHKKQSTTLDIYSKWLPEDDPVDHAAAMPRVPAGEAKVAPGAGVAAIDAIVTPNRGVLTPRRRQSRR